MTLGPVLWGVVCAAESRTLGCVGLRPTSTRQSEALRRRLETLVLERQSLRDRRASEVVLEQNRLEIVQTQLEYSQALVLEHDVGAAATPHAVRLTAR